MATLKLIHLRLFLFIDFKILILMKKDYAVQSIDKLLFMTSTEIFIVLFSIRRTASYNLATVQQLIAFFKDAFCEPSWWLDSLRY